VPSFSPGRLSITSQSSNCAQFKNISIDRKNKDEIMLERP